jgi:hypothetical protein
MSEQLNHHNPEYVTWKHEELNFTLLGGIRIEGLPMPWFVSHHNCSEDLWRFFIQHTFGFLWVSSTKYYYVINNICF